MEKLPKTSLSRSCDIISNIMNIQAAFAILLPLSVPDTFILFSMILLIYLLTVLPLNLNHIPLFNCALLCLSQLHLLRQHYYGLQAIACCRDPATHSFRQNLSQSQHAGHHPFPLVSPAITRRCLFLLALKHSHHRQLTFLCNVHL